MCFTAYSVIPPKQLNVPDHIAGGTNITVSWTSGASLSTSPLWNYHLERSINGGGYQLVCDTRSFNLSCEQYIAYGWQTVQFRIKAFDNQGSGSSYRESQKVSIYNEVAPTTPGYISVPDGLKGSGNATVSWGASSDANGNLAGYRLERSVNGGGWEQVWQGAGTSCAQNIVYGWGSVAFRVKAYDHAGWQSGYATGPTRSVHNNTAPTVPPHITVPELICGGDDITVGWGESSDADNNFAGYRLECSINGGAFSQVYQGTELSSIQSVAKEWESVAFRVKAYDSDGFESQYATTPNRTVVHNPDAPSEIAYGEPVALKEIRLSCAPAPGTDESGMSYVWERSIDAGEFLQFQVTAQPLASDVVPDNGARYQARVKAVDPQGLASSYQTGADKQIYCKGDSVYMKADVGASCFLHVCARAAADTKDKEMTLHYDSAALQLNSFDFIPVDGADFTREGVEGHNARLVSSQRGQCGLVCVKALEQNAVWDGVVAVCGFTALGTEPTQVVLL